MNVLLLGSGGREHAIALALSRSPDLTRLIVVPGNPGTAAIAENIALPLDGHDGLLTLAQERAVDLLVVGPEVPLVAGVADRFRAAGIPVFGPGAAAARLEGSKSFTKDLCREFNVPTAAYETFTAADPAKAYVRHGVFPVVIKADGLAAGKGVIIAADLDEAETAIDDIFGGLFGGAGSQVVIEEFLEGEEVSFFALCDGTRALPFASAQDHKRVGEGDTGPNTGGMGAISPAPLMTPTLEGAILDRVIRPTLAGMASRGTPFQGVLFAGLMIDRGGEPSLIEYNVRFGDPEAEVMIPRLDQDLLPLLHGSATGALPETPLRFRPDVALGVVMAARGYPEAPQLGTRIGSLEPAKADPDVLVFHAGTRHEGEALVAAGGRVLVVTAQGESALAAQNRAYAAVDRIDWPEGFCRRDIGWRAVEREQARDADASM